MIKRVMVFKSVSVGLAEYEVYELLDNGKWGKKYDNKIISFEDYIEYEQEIEALRYLLHNAYVYHGATAFELCQIDIWEFLPETLEHGNSGLILEYMRHSTEKEKPNG